MGKKSPRAYFLGTGTALAEIQTRGGSVPKNWVQSGPVLKKGII